MHVVIGIRSRIFSLDWVNQLVIVHDEGRFVECGHLFGNGEFAGAREAVDSDHGAALSLFSAMSPAWKVSMCEVLGNIGWAQRYLFVLV